MHGILDDVRGAVRALWRSPAFCVTAAGTLAVGIAINAAMFSVLNAIFFRPPPYPEAELLFNLTISAPPGQSTAALPERAPTLGDVRGALGQFGEVAGFRETNFIVRAVANAASESVPGVLADPGLFGLLQVAPQLGRGFGPEDARAGAPPVAVVSDVFWRSRLGGTRAALAQTVRVDGVDHTVIGVMPPRFDYPMSTRVWIPLTDPEARRVRLEARADVDAVVRVREPGTRTQAAAAVQAAVSGLDSTVVVRLSSLQEPADALLIAVLAAIGFVLLIACTNVANLVLARGTSRQDELAIRAALGASRARLIRYLTVESAVLALLAVISGTIASQWLLDLLIATLPVDEVPGWFNAQPDARVLAYISGLGALTVLVAGVIPTLNIARSSVWSLMAGASTRTTGSRSTGRLRATLIGVQIALAMMLLVATGRMVRSFNASVRYNPGYPASSALEIRTHRLPAAAGSDAFIEEAVTRLAALPDVVGAGALTPSNLTGAALGNTGEELTVLAEAVSPTALSAMGLPLLRGRPIRQNEAGVVLVSRAVAGRLFGSVDAALLGTIQFRNDSTDQRFAVIGVVGDRGLPGDRARAGQRTPYVYVPMSGGDRQYVRLVARTRGSDPLQLATAAVGLIRQIDPDVVTRAPRIMHDAERERYRDVSWFASLFAGFGFTAMLLATLGIYGVVAYAVSRRRRELAVRIALGATRAHILRHVIGTVAPAAAWGLGFGLLGAVALNRLLRDVMFGVPPADPISFAGAFALFLTVALTAALLPARRAARIDPLRALAAP